MNCICRVREVQRKQMWRWIRESTQTRSYSSGSESSHAIHMHVSQDAEEVLECLEINEIIFWTSTSPSLSANYYYKYNQITVTLVYCIYKDQMIACTHYSICNVHGNFILYKILLHVHVERKLIYKFKWIQELTPLDMFHEWEKQNIL